MEFLSVALVLVGTAAVVAPLCAVAVMLADRANDKELKKH